MSSPASETVTEYATRRLELTADASYADLRRRLDEQVPPLDDEDVRGLESGSTAWSDFVRGLAWSSPSGFVRLWRYDPTPVLRHSGSTLESTSYVVADLAIAARAVRIDPAALLAAPLRLELQSRPGGSALVVEQPSAALRSFDRNKLTQAGAELDRRLGDLIEALGLPRPSAFRQ